MFSGYQRPQKYIPESKSVKNFGMLLPRIEVGGASPEVMDNDGIGDLDGTYIYSAIEVDSQANLGEGLRSGPVKDSQGISVTVQNGSVVLTFANGAVNSETDEIWLYRSAAGGAWPVLGRIAKIALGTLTYTDSGDTPDFLNYGLDIFRYPYPNKAYNFKLHRRLIGWGTEDLEVYFTVTVGETTAVWSSGDPLDAGCVGMVLYPDTDTRGYVIVDFIAGSPISVVLKDAFEGPASPDTNTVKCKLCRASGELRWSEPDDYENGPLANVRYVEKAGADPETGAAAINGRGLLFTVSKTFAMHSHPIYGPTLLQGNVIELSNAIGCLSHRTIRECDGWLLWLAEGGIAASGGGMPRIISDDIAPEFGEILKETTGRCRSAFAVNWKAKRRYICFVPKVGDTVGCSRAIVCEYGRVPGEPQFRFTIYEFQKEFTCGTMERHTVIGDDGTNYTEFPVIGDEDGFVWSLGIGDADGPDEGTVAGTITEVSTSPATMTDENATLKTSGLGLAGVVVTIRRASDGAEQRLNVTGNSTDTFTFAQSWDWLPGAGDVWWAGGIEGFYETGHSALGSSTRLKALERVVTAFNQESAGVVAALKVFKDFSLTDLDLTQEGKTLDLNSETGREARQMSKAEGFHFKFRWGNDQPDQPFTLRSAAVLAEAKEP